jgi:hypothetical protein
MVEGVEERGNGEEEWGRRFESERMCVGENE